MLSKFPIISSASAKMEYIAIYNGKGNVGPPKCLFHVATKKERLTNSNRTVSAAGMLVSEATDLIICT